MSFNESGRKKYVEQPHLEHLTDASVQAGEAPQQRTVEQQQKQEKLIAQERRAAGLETARSRSSSRRDRRKRIRRALEDGGAHMKTAPLAALEEADANQDLHAMRPFERIGPDSTSMDGPVTMARAMRAEIPVRGSNPNQPYYLQPEEVADSQLKNTEGLKLSLEANLDIEIELKASIRGDLTLSL